MLDTDETGQQKLVELLKVMNQTDLWTDWEHKFLIGVKGNEYKSLPQKAKAKVGELHEKLVLG